jgi:hypothetical protein
MGCPPAQLGLAAAVLAAGHLADLPARRGHGLHGDWQDLQGASASAAITVMSCAGNRRAVALRLWIASADVGGGWPAVVQSHDA